MTTPIDFPDHDADDDFDSLAGIAPPPRTRPAVLPPPVAVTLPNGNVVMVQPPAGWTPPSQRTIDEQDQDRRDLERGARLGDEDLAREEANAKRKYGADDRRRAKEADAHKAEVARQEQADAAQAKLDAKTEAARGRVASSASRAATLKAKRAAMTARDCPLGISFLDDAVGALVPPELVLTGAYTGAGKTQLVMSIAAAAARAGRRVFMIAIEADDDEIENRIVFRETQRLAFAAGLGPMTYRDWYRNKVAGVEGYTDQATAMLEAEYESLLVHYGRVTPEYLREIVLAEKGRSDLIIVDHLHYVESDDVNELRAQRDMMRMLRVVTTEVGIPIVAVAHLRKKALQGKYTSIMPDTDDFMGSSEIAKISTGAIMLARAPRTDIDPSYHLPTYMSFAKERRNGATGYVARIAYDLRLGDYAPTYTLGVIADNVWMPVAPADLPHWAKHATNR